MSNYDPLDIVGQQRAREDRELKDKLAKENEESDTKWLMASKRGRRIVWRLLDQAGVFRLSFNPNAMHMAFAEGNRNYGLRTLTMIHAVCPEMYQVMLKEQNDGNNRTNNSNNDDSTPNTNNG